MIPKLLVAVNFGSEPPGVSLVILQMLFVTPFLKHLALLVSRADGLWRGDGHAGTLGGQHTDLLLGKVATGLR